MPDTEVPSGHDATTSTVAVNQGGVDKAHSLPAPVHPPLDNVEEPNFDRRLIIITVEAGQEVDVDWIGEWEWWELLAALARAEELVQDWQVEAEGEEDE